MRPLCVAAGWALAAAIVWLSLTPSPTSIDVEQGDKLGHFLAYGSLMGWFSLLYLRPAPRAGYAALWIAMGIGLEFVQGWLGYRDFEVFDMVADAIGVFAGWAAAVPLQSRIRLPR
jgi:VanZ family protein